MRMKTALDEYFQDFHYEILAQNYGNESLPDTITVKFSGLNFAQKETLARLCHKVLDLQFHSVLDSLEESATYGNEVGIPYTYRVTVYELPYELVKG